MTFCSGKNQPGWFFFYKRASAEVVKLMCEKVLWRCLLQTASNSRALCGLHGPWWPHPRLSPMQMQTAEGIAVWRCLLQTAPVGFFDIQFDHYWRSPVCSRKKSTEQSPGVVLMSQPLEAQQNVPLKQMYLISAIKIILYQSQMTVCRLESTQLNRNFYAKPHWQDSSQDQNQNSNRKLLNTLVETSQTTESYCSNLLSNFLSQQARQKRGGL